MTRRSCQPRTPRIALADVGLFPAHLGPDSNSSWFNSKRQRHHFVSLVYVSRSLSLRILFSSFRALTIARISGDVCICLLSSLRSVSLALSSSAASRQLLGRINVRWDRHGRYLIKFAEVIYHPRKTRDIDSLIGWLIERDTDLRDWPLRLRCHEFEHLLEVSKKAIDRSGAEEKRLVNASARQPIAAFAKHQDKIG